MAKSTSTNGTKAAKVAEAIPENETLIDVRLEVPTEVDGEAVEGYPATIHILFSKDVVDFAGQYRDALFTARGIPFDLAGITPGDIMALSVANMGGITKTISSEEAVRRARQIYSSWGEIAEQHAWTLAILYDNDFTHQPKPYPDKSLKKYAPGVPVLPEPEFDLADPVEFRLKQILDVINLSVEFRRHVEKHINDVLTRMAQYGEAVREKDVLGFRPGGIGAAVRQSHVPPGDDHGSEPGDVGSD